MEVRPYTLHLPPVGANLVFALPHPYAFLSCLFQNTATK